MKCLNIKCNNEHTGTFGSGKYCSRKCANSRQWSKEDKFKKSKSAKESEKLILYNNSESAIENLKNMSLIKKENAKINILSADWDSLSFGRLRKRIIWEQNDSCNICKINKWNGKKLTLEIDHIDGNRNNNKRDNVEAICPNCHSQTPTWRGRNKTNRIKKISDEKLLLTLIKNKWNIRQSLIKLNLAPKGGNYKRCNNLKKSMKLGSIPGGRTI